MIDMIVDRRDLKSTIAWALRFMRAQDRHRSAAETA
jgi:acetyl-CoA carboxylase beta subunit